jgi:hypothetical protein
VKVVNLEHIDKRGENVSLINKSSKLLSMQAGYTKFFPFCSPGYIPACHDHILPNLQELFVPSVQMRSGAYGQGFQKNHWEDVTQEAVGTFNRCPLQLLFWLRKLRSRGESRTYHQDP